VRIREGAPLELPHIMVLIDDPANSVIGPVTDKKDRLTALYDFDLMMDAGHLSGRLIGDRALEEQVMAALTQLAAPEAFRTKYGFTEERPVLLYAMGDGNHSLATAKAIWEKTKEQASDPAEVMATLTRYALVELVNVHDEALEFEPIHRVVFDLAGGADPLDALEEHYGPRYDFSPVGSMAEMKERVATAPAGVHRIGVVRYSDYGVVQIRKPDSNLAVGSLQVVLDRFMKEGRAADIDYVHGTDTVDSLGRKPGNMGFYLPAMDKHQLFKSVIVDGALPRKTFSMGEAYEKRFYAECRALR